MVSRDEMRKKSWEEEALLELLFTSPNSVTEDDLKSISLSNLAKNMNDELPSRTLMKTYIRWLEAHRKCPTHLIKTWPNTIKQWVESLKNRGFAKEEVISDFENWKKVNRSITRHSEGLDEGKWHPSADDIDRAFGEKHTTKRERSSDIFQTYRDRYPGRSNVSKSSLAFVPKSYVCNRCGKHGHLVQQCPTNMDPSFDKKPPESYKCSICNKFGKHWFSLCPENKDRESITQRRLAAKKGVSTKERGLDQRDGHRLKQDKTSMPDDIGHMGGREWLARQLRTDKWEKFGPLDSFEQEQTTSLDYYTGEEPEHATKLERLADIEERMQIVSEAMARDTGMTVESVAEMAGVTISNVAATIMAANRKRARSVETDNVDDMEHQRIIRKRVQNDEREKLMHDLEDARFLNSDVERQDAGVSGIFKETDPYTERYGLRQNLQFTRSGDPAESSLRISQSGFATHPRKMTPMDTSSDEDIRTPVHDMEEGFSSPRVRSETPEKYYSDFVRNLIENRTEHQIVNQRRRRPTALEVWDQNDQRRMTQLHILSSTPHKSPTLSSISSFGSDLTSNAIQVDHPRDHTLGQATKEAPHLSMNDNTPIPPLFDTAMQSSMFEGWKSDIPEAEREEIVW